MTESLPKAFGKSVEHYPFPKNGACGLSQLQGLSIIDLVKVSESNETCFRFEISVEMVASILSVLFTQV